MVECTQCHQKFEPVPGAPEDSLCPECAAKPPDSGKLPQLNPHDVIDGYEILKLIGTGGMGSVYLAMQHSMQREVAFKILNPDRTKNEESVSKFMAEVKNAGKLVHPNIVTAYDAGHSGNFYYMVMQYIKGDTVDNIIDRNGPFPEEKALGIILQIASALEYVWKKYSMFHRDIKPGNFMLDEDGSAMLMDMGIAQGISDHSVNKDGTVEGSPYYMSPEQIQAQPLSWTTDLYSLGASFFQMLTGVPPYDGADLEEILKKHCSEPVPDASQRNPGVKVSAAAMALIRKMMAKTPAERFASWEEFIKEAEKVRKGPQGLKIPKAGIPALKPPTPAGKPATPALKPVAPGLKPAAPAPKPAETPKTGAKPPEKPAEAPKTEEKAPEKPAETPEQAAARKAKRKKKILILIFSFAGLLLLAGLGAGGYYAQIAFRKNQADSAIQDRMKEADQEMGLYQKNCESPAEVTAKLKLIEEALANPDAAGQWKEAGKKKIQEIRGQISAVSARIRAFDASLAPFAKKYKALEQVCVSEAASLAGVRSAINTLDSELAALNRLVPLNSRQKKAKVELVSRFTILRPKLVVKADAIASKDAGNAAKREQIALNESQRQFQAAAKKADEAKARQEAENIRRQKEDAERKQRQQKQKEDAERRQERQKRDAEARKRLKVLQNANAGFLEKFAGMAAREEFAQAASLTVPPEITALGTLNSQEKRELDKLRKTMDRYVLYAKQAEEIHQLMRSSAVIAMNGEQFTVYEKKKQVPKRVTRFENETVYTNGGKYVLTDLSQHLRSRLVKKVADSAKKGKSMTGYWLMHGMFRFAYRALNDDKQTRSELEKFSIFYIRIGYKEAQKRGDLSAVRRFEQDYQGMDVWYKALNIPKPKPKPKAKPKPAPKKPAPAPAKIQKKK